MKQAKQSKAKQALNQLINQSITQSINQLTWEQLLFVHTPSQESSLILHLSSTDCTGLLHPVLTASNQASKQARKEGRKDSVTTEQQH
jgi:hypothetical protein